MKKIKILQVNKLYYPVTGGIEKVVQQIAEGLNEETDMKVLVCQEGIGRSSLDIVNNVSVHRAGSIGRLFSMPISVPFFLQIRKLSKDRDILHFHMPFPLGDLACLLSGFKGKVVVWWHSDIVRQKKLMKIYKPIMERFLKRADVIIVATQGHIDGSKYLNKYSHKCKIIPFGLDKNIEVKSKSYYENKIKRNSSKPVNILFVGRLVYYKGCDVLLKAFQEVKNAELTIIGNGDLELKLKDLAIKLGIEKRTHFLGNVNDKELGIAFEMCDIFVLPSIQRSEAFGLVQLEAMAYGKPVINTNLPSGVPYVSINNVTGFTVEPGNIRALKNAIQWLVDHENERIEMGRKARERVKENYNMDDMLEKIHDVYVCLAESI